MGDEGGGGKHLLTRGEWERAVAVERGSSCWQVRELGVEGDLVSNAWALAKSTSPLESG